MRLTSDEFTKKYDSGELALSFIGMSGVGKSFWSKKMTKIGMQHVSCDKYVADILGDTVKSGEHDFLEALSDWMGLPHEDRYRNNQNICLCAEIIAITNIASRVESDVRNNTVVDTTGSFVHAGEDVCNSLRDVSLMIYFDISDDMKSEMYERYIRDQKPIIFGDIYSRLGGESEKEALLRSYQKLLDHRLTLYPKYADVVIAPNEIKSIDNAKQFLSLVKEKL